MAFLTLKTLVSRLQKWLDCFFKATDETPWVTDQQPNMEMTEGNAEGKAEGKAEGEVNVDFHQPSLRP